MALSLKVESNVSPYYNDTLVFQKEIPHRFMDELHLWRLRFLRGFKHEPLNIVSCDLVGMAV
jgi:hypothetical protein